MTVSARPLTFSSVDDLAFAAAKGRLDAAQLPTRFAVENLGPLLELFHLAAGGKLPDPTEGGWLDLNGSAVMIAALREKHECCLSSSGRRMGFIRAARPEPDAENRLTAFLMDAQRAARDVTGLPGTTPGQVAAAMQELESNIHEHSGATDTGLLAFWAGPGEFEFVAADRGIGILASLQSSSTYASMVDHGKALQLALTDGVSRFDGDERRGHGFRPIFLGLVNLQGSLRFRSGDHALTMDGTSPTLTTAELAQKVMIDGFFAGVRVMRGLE